jgi:hypothetical protein
MSHAGFGQEAEWAIGGNAVQAGHELSPVSSIYLYSCDMSAAYFINSEMASSPLTVEASVPGVHRAGQILAEVFC